MLPPFIIEQIRQREEQKRWDDRPRLELPLDGMMPPLPMGTPADDPEDAPRGVVILDI
jgi:hypothetical protein